MLSMIREFVKSCMLLDRGPTCTIFHVSINNLHCPLLGFYSDKFDTHIEWNVTYSVELDQIYGGILTHFNGEIEYSLS